MTLPLASRTTTRTRTTLTRTLNVVGVSCEITSSLGRLASGFGASWDVLEGGVCEVAEGVWARAARRPEKGRRPPKKTSQRVIGRLPKERPRKSLAMRPPFHDVVKTSVHGTCCQCRIIGT